MANPFVPVLVSPAVKGAGDGAAAIQFQFQYNHPDPGVAGNAYYLRRRAMTPSIGAYEYWTGAAWGASTAVALAMTPGTTYTVSTTGWVNGTVYQWSVQARDASSNLSGYGPDRLIDVHAKPAPTITQPTGGQVYSTPKIVWNWVSAASKKQRSYQLFIYKSTVYGDPGFDPASANWQSFADFKMTQPYISSTDWFDYPDGFVIQPSITYKVYGMFTDETGLASAWITSPTFTSSVTLPLAPTFTAAARPDLGDVLLNLTAQLNLLTDPQSDLTDNSTGGWFPTQNCNLVPSVAGDPSFSGSYSMKVTAAGLTYGELDTLHTTYTAEDTAYTTFGVMKGAQGGVAGVAKYQLPTGLNGRPVTPTTVYSALTTLYPLASGHQARVNIRWYKADGAASAVTPLSSGVLASITTNTWNTLKTEAVTSPSDAAFAALEVEFNSADLGDVIYHDASVFSAGATIVWSPSFGGNLSYVVERQNADGTWTELWGCSRKVPLHPPGGTATIAFRDRDVGLNESATTYRAFTQMGPVPDFALSNPVTVTVAVIDSATWWIRDIKNAANDVALLPSSRDHTFTPEMEVLKPLSSTNRLFLTGNAPNDESLRLRAWCKDNATYQKLSAILKSRNQIVIQTNRHGEVWYGYCPEGYADSQIRATTDEVGQRVRSLFALDFILETTSRPAI